MKKDERVMKMKQQIKQLSLVCALVVFAFACSSTIAAQEKRAELTSGMCESGWVSWTREERKVSGYRECRTEELRLPAATAKLNVDGRKNGGINVTGWDQREMLVRARIETWNDDIEAARRIVSQIKIEFNGNRIRATAPIGDATKEEVYSVSYDIFVPRESDLALVTFNGGISIKHVCGQIEFKASNGGIALADLAGDVRGETTNGGVSVKLAGATWDGAVLNARTTNGGVMIEVPEGFASRLVTGTTWGGVKADFPIDVQSEARTGKNASATLNPVAEGAFVRVVTTNGGVRIKRRGASGC